ncbi:aminotransferase class IV [Clostridium weizhouense]|uniref:Aminotransferase class IV n=1 Tax=Clostridium weizhouense TaxID=2859781 RepID=A0ABS7AJ82_9CLOT|nr:aminotransferase class IV [Clostridium weizhouense]MBW6408604.1 aminotransferase class IV [Clostridium weizhouense]
MECINNFFIEDYKIKETTIIDENEIKNKIIYEVLRVIHGKALFLENHLVRMKNSFKLINLDYPLNDKELTKSIEELIEKNNKLEGNIKIIYNVDTKKLKIFFIKHNYPTESMYENGVKTILYFGERENPNAKIVNRTFRDKVNNKIKEENAYEAILVDKNGYITEGSKSNIFMIKDNMLLTSPVRAVLPGVTRGEIIELAIKNNIEVKEMEYKYSDIKELDGMFICGTSPKVLPINEVNNIKFNKNNDIIKNIMKYYNKKIEDYINKY